MDLADFQDPTGVSKSSLWKLLSLLKRNKKSPLRLFYELIETEQENKTFSEPLGQNQAELIELMTIHKSKGLQFKHVIVLDFSMGESVLESHSSEVIYDSLRQKISVSVPLGTREKKKIKAYGHKLYQAYRRGKQIQEKDHLFYVAMTRAEESLALFVPQGKKPKKNSWLSRITYFEKIENLLNKNQWKFNTGIYQREKYLLTVKNCNTL